MSINEITNLDLLAVAITTSAIITLGFTVYFNNTKSVTNQSFLFFSILTVLYSVTNYLVYQATNLTLGFWLLKLTIFFAIWHAFSFFRLFYVFPNDLIIFPKSYKYLLLPLVTVSSLVAFTPLIFSSIKAASDTGKILEVNNGPAIVLFGLIILSLVVSGIFIVIRKAIRVQSGQRKPYKLVALGTFITFSFIIIFNFILPALLDKSRYVGLAPVFFFPFVILTFYAISKQNLLKIKVLATSTLTFVLSIVSLFEVIVAKNNLELVIFRSGIFILVVTLGILIVKSVFREVEQREKIEKLAKDLQLANDKLKELDQLKSEFLSLATHQIRAPLTAIKGYSSMLLEGDFGVLPPKAASSVEIVMKSCQNLINIVNDFLNISRIEQGRMVYEKSIFDIGALVNEVANEIKPNIQNAGLELQVNIKSAKQEVNADRNKIKQAISNLIDNSIKYTVKGDISIAVFTEGNKVKVAIKDTGVGIDPQEMGKLFAKFSRTKDANKTNVIGTGLGLYIAKKMVEAHQGDIKVDSDGLGKGTTFTIELPKYS